VIFEGLHHYLRWPSSAPLSVYFLATFAAAVIVRPVAAEVYSSDSGIEISGTGPRASRSCTVLLKPTQALGDNLAPRLTLVTAGTSRLSFGVDGPAQYSNLVMVQNNARRPLIGNDSGSAEQFRFSDIGKALRSQRLFFITAQRSDSGKFVSSRYERIDLDAIMAKVEAACPFDAESLMTDLASREQAERALLISLSDMALIRWALNKRYSGSPNKPESSFSLLSQERNYLKRYAGDNGLPLSQYLTAETARRLTLEGQLAASSATPPPSPPPPSPPPPASPSWPPAPSIPKESFWSLDGARVALRVEPDKPGRTFLYENPPDSLRRAGVRNGTVVFIGVRSRERYTGKAYSFSAGCVPTPYDVAGDVSEDQRQVTLRGSAPVRDAACKITARRSETLIFVFHDVQDNWGEPRR
jgi:hypothetical protein